MCFKFEYHTAAAVAASSLPNAPWWIECPRLTHYTRLISIELSPSFTSCLNCFNSVYEWKAWKNRLFTSSKPGRLKWLPLWRMHLTSFQARTRRQRQYEDRHPFRLHFLGRYWHKEMALWHLVQGRHYRQSNGGSRKAWVSKWCRYYNEIRRALWKMESWHVFVSLSSHLEKWPIRGKCGDH